MSSDASPVGRPLVVLPRLDAATFRAHALHDPARAWPETNCYTDLWIEVIASLGLPPEAMLGFACAQDFEGDQFTFFKPSLDDLAALYGVQVGELSIFDTVEAHVREQATRGRLCLVEVDAFYLPDTRGVSYRTAHSKTTIAINDIDSAQRRLGYFHNAGYFCLEGDDYDAILPCDGAPVGDSAILFPYVEFAKLPSTPVAPTDRLVIDILQRHLRSRPSVNPLAAYREAAGAHVERLMQRSEAFFHLYAFNTLRQVGANFSLLAAHLRWLCARKALAADGAAAHADALSDGAKALQFQLARAVARRKAAAFADGLSPLVERWDEMMRALDTTLGAQRAAA